MIKKNEITTFGNDSPIYSASGDIIINSLPKKPTFNPHSLKIILSKLEQALSDEVQLKCITEDEVLNKIDIEMKNKINKLEQEGIYEYAELINENSKYFNIIRETIADVRNKDIHKSYKTIKTLIKLKLPQIKSKTNYYFEVLNYVIDDLIDSKDKIILDNQLEVVVVVHFMYYICDIGEVK